MNWHRDISIYRFWGNQELDLDGVHDGLVVAGLSKLHSRAKRSIQFINRLGYRSSLVIIDKAHQAIAETYKLVLDSLVNIQIKSKNLYKKNANRNNI